MNMHIAVTSSDLLLAHIKRFITCLLAVMLISPGIASGQEKETAPVLPQQGVELLFPVGTGKQTKGAKLSKAEKLADALLKKLKAIEKDGDINSTDEQGQTALMHAAEQGNKLAVCWLVAKGADASIKSKIGKTAGDFVKEENENMKDLLKACCEEKLPLPEEEKHRYKSAEEAQKKLEETSSLDSVATALRAGAHADRLPPKIYRGTPGESLAFLIRHGMPVAPFNKTDWKDATPPQLRLLLACGMPKESDDTRKKLIFALLLDDIPGIEACLQQEPSLAREAEYYGRAQSAAAVQALLKAAGEVPDGAACLKAVLENSYNGAAVKALLDAGVPVPKDEETLELLVSNYYTGEDYATYDGELRSKPGVVQAMLDAGLDPNYTFSEGNTLLHCATDHGNLAIVRALLKKGANVNALNKDNDTPLSLIFANKHECGNAANEGAIVQALLKSGAKIDLGNLSQKLEDAVIDNGFVSPRSKKEQDEFIAGLKAVLQAGFKVPANILLYCGNPDMPDAKWEEVALLLLEHGADPKATSNEKWDNGKTTLMEAGCLGPRIAQKLLDAGVDPNAVTTDGDSALKNALTRNHAEVAKLLHDKGARYSGDLLICHPDCMQIMLEDGAKIPSTIYEDLFDHGTMHSSHLALTQEQYARVIELLEKAGAAPDSVAFNDLKARNEVAKRAFVSSFQDPQTRDKDGNTLLFLAEGADIEKLIRAGADPHAVNNKGETPLFRALSLEDIQTFMRRGVRINTQDHEGNTALMTLVQRGSSAETVKAFLDAGANPNLKNKAGKTALQIAREKKLDHIVKLLKGRGAREETDNPNAKDKDGRTTLILAALDPDGLSRLKECIARKGNVNARDNKGCTALRLLMGRDGDINSRVQELLNAKADVNLGDFTDFTPLMTAACYKDTAKRRFRVQRLIGARANVNAAGKAGNTAAMHLLLHYDDPDTLRMLLDAGAKLDHKNGEGKTMLDLATENHRSACIKLLNERKAPGAQTDPKARDSEGRTALMLVVRKKGSEGEIRSLLRRGADINARDNGGNTALHHLLTVGGNIDARLEALLAAHPDVNLTTYYGTTPLMILDVCADPKESASRIKKLLACHAKVDLKDAGGRTAAMRYVEKGDNAGALRLLLDAGADLELKNKNGKTLLQLAQKHKRTACVRLLQEHLAAADSNRRWWYIIGGALLVLLIGTAGFFLRRRK